MATKKIVTKEKDFIVKKSFFEQHIRWKPNDVIKLTENRAAQIGIPKYVVPTDYKEPRPAKKFFQSKKGTESKTDEKTKEASRTLLDTVMPGVANGV